MGRLSRRRAWAPFGVPPGGRDGLVLLSRVAGGERDGTDAGDDLHESPCPGPAGG